MTPFSLRRTAAAGLLAIATVGATLGVASAQQAPISPSADTPAIAVGQDGTERFAQQPAEKPGQPGRPGNGERPQLTDEQRQQMEQQREQAQQRYIDLLAKNLNLDSATVKAALEQTQKDLQAARIAEIKQAVTDGKLTQEQADQIIQRMQQGPGPMMGPGGPGGPGFGPGGPGGPGGPRGGPGGPDGGTGR
jgi:anti-sigma28 factor (negative regulator of flagellin synthesis)